MALWVCARTPRDFWPSGVKGIGRILETRDRIAAFADAASDHHRAHPSIVTAELLVFALIEAQEFGRAREIIQSQIAGDERVSANMLRARTQVSFELARYAETVDTVSQSSIVCPEETRRRFDFLKGAFAASMLLRQELALELVGRQFEFIPDDVQRADAEDLEAIRRTVIERTLDAVILPLLSKTWDNHAARIGVFFLSSTEALGHAILDPYHFLALNRLRYDIVFFVGPPRESYRPASRICLEIVEQYGTYVPTNDVLLQNLSWMSLGTISKGPMEIVIENYWSLLREATHRAKDPRDPFKHNAWHMSLPRHFQRIGDAFRAKHGIADGKPIVVLHVRESGYHGLAKQGYRDAQIADYEPAVRHLLQLGYQIIRIGDHRMAPLPLHLEGYFELPFMADYSPRLDPYFISRCAFMIGSQSGPCAYARALGRPVVSANAVYHYTLLPAPKEIGCFKHYVRDQGGLPHELSAEEILGARLSHYDNAHQFAAGGIELRGATSQEVLVAVCDMIDWLADPACAATPEQNCFSALVERVAGDLVTNGDAQPPIADYLGISLPGYRIARGTAPSDSA